MKGDGVLATGPAKKVTIYVNEETRYEHSPLWLAIFEYLRHKQVAGVTVTQSRLSLGGQGKVHHGEAAESAEYSMRVEFIETASKAEQLLPTLYGMVTDGLIEAQDTTIVKAARPEREGKEVRYVKERREGRGKMLRVYLGEDDRWEGDPLHEAIVNKLRMMDIAGATVYRGILGYGAKGQTHKEGFFHLSRDLPLMITVVDTPEKVETAKAAVEEMLEDGLIVVSDVDLVRVYRRPAATD
jgi:PII-like signaling protein